MADVTGVCESGEDIENEVKMFLEVGAITKPWKNLQNAGVLWYRQKNYDRALSCLTHAIDLVERFLTIGNETFFEKILLLFPTEREHTIDPDIKRYYTDLQVDLGILYNTRGVIRIEKGDFTGGMDDFEKAVFFAPHLANGHFNRAQGLMSIEKYEEAYRELEIAVILAPHDEEIRAVLKNCREMLKKRSWKPHIHRKERQREISK